MTTKLVGVAGAKFYFGGTTTTATADTYIQIGNVMDGGKVGANFKDVPVETIDNALVRHLKGTEDPGTMTLQVAQDLTDAGQLAVQAALPDQTNDYNIKIVLPNPLTTTGTGDTIYVKGKVMSYDTEFGGPNNPVRATINFGLNSIRTFVSAV